MKIISISLSRSSSSSQPWQPSRSTIQPFVSSTKPVWIIVNIQWSFCRQRLFSCPVFYPAITKKKTKLSMFYETVLVCNNLTTHFLSWKVTVSTALTTTAVPVQKTSSASNNSSTETSHSWTCLNIFWVTILIS